MIEEIAAWTAAAAVTGAFYTMIFRDMYNEPHRQIFEKAPVIMALTTTIVVAVMIVNAPDPAIELLAYMLFLTVLLAIGAVGLIITYAYAGGRAITVLGSLSVHSIAESMTFAGIAYLVVVIMAFIEAFIGGGSMERIMSHMTTYGAWVPVVVVRSLMSTEAWVASILVVVYILLVFILEVLLVALPEEMYARGFTLLGLGTTMPWSTTAAISMGIWTFLHAITRVPMGASIALIPITFGGILLSHLAVKYSLVESILAHALYNTSIIALLTLWSIGVPIIVALIAPLVFLLGLGYLLRRASHEPEVF